MYAKRAISVVVLLLAVLLGGCDTIAHGYINRLPHGVTIVEHPGPKIHPFTLAPGQVDQPGFGQNPRAFDVISPAGHVIATYRSRELPVSGREFYRYVVLDSRGAHIETKAEMLKGSE